MKNVFVLALVVAFFAGCASLVDKAGQALDGSAFEEKKIAVYSAADMELWEMQNKAGEHSLIIFLNRFPAMKIRTAMPDASGDFNVTALDYLGGNPHGWNEYRLELFGQGTASLGGTSASIAIPGDIEPVQIAWGRIRRYDTRITGNEALTNLRNRRERILALCEWMNSLPNLPELAGRPEFETYWKPLLFPEMVAKKKRPAGWEQKSDIRVKAEDIRWNTGYTERVFPELLAPIRNSGTMLRDWEEALDWIYMEYEWERIKERLSQETLLMRKK
ncbi:MAG: hypothetical protein FWG46_06250 [Treponema sp.]|nr:hypothetical protein [Treponema sp.]